MTDANFLSFINPKLAAEQQKLQTQQALAKRLMEQGTTPDSDINKLANPGGFVVPYSPLQGLAKIGQAASGKYLQDKSIEDQSKIYADMLNPQGASADPQAAALGNALDGGTPGQAQPPTQQNILDLAKAGTVTGNPQTDMMFMMQSPTDYMKSLATRNAPTDLFKNVNNPATQPYMAKDQLINVNGHFQPATSLLPPSGGQAAPQSAPLAAPPMAAPQGDSAITPQSPQGQAALGDLYNTQPASPQGQGGAVNLASPAGNNVDWNNPADVAGATEYTKKTGAFYGDLSNNLQQAAFDNNSKISDYKQIDSLLNGIDTGKFEGNINDLQKIASRFGFDLPQNVGPVEAANALATRLALEARNDGGKNLMPGAMSNYEDKLLQGMKPGIENTTAGRKIMINFAIKKLTRDQQLADLAANYEDTHGGRLDRNFNKEVKKFVTENPLYKEGELEANIAAANQAQQKVSGTSGPQTKVIGRKTYTFINGEWHE